MRRNVATVVCKDDKILLVRRRGSGTWALPGGYAEHGEKSYQASIRETWEETGITVKLDSEQPILESKCCKFFSGEFMKGDIKPQFTEVSDVRFVTADEANRMLKWGSNKLATNKRRKRLWVQYIY